MTISEIAEDIPVPLVRSTLGDDVDNGAGRTPKLSRISGLEDLKLLDCLLRYSGPDSINRVVDGVGAVNAHHVGPSALTSDVQPAGRCWCQLWLVLPGDRRVQQSE